LDKEVYNPNTALEPSIHNVANSTPQDLIFSRAGVSGKNFKTRPQIVKATSDNAVQLTTRTVKNLRQQLQNKQQSDNGDHPAKSHEG
jgi:hypothetical protein